MATQIRPPVANTTTGQVYIWIMNGSTLTSGASLGYVSSDWSVAVIGDFNGDGEADILWWNSTTGQVYVWFINGTTMTGGGGVSYVSSGGRLRASAISMATAKRTSCGGTDDRPGLHLVDERLHVDEQRKPRLGHHGLEDCRRRRFQ